MARAFARQLTNGERLPYTVAVHRGESKEKGKPDNPHAHIVLSERSNDGRPRSAATWFRRANRSEPGRGGARKVTQLQAREWPERIRQGWAGECNRALERAGRAERIDPRTLAEQAREALEQGDLDQASELSRMPEPKRGAGDAIQRRYEQGQAPEPSRAVAAWKRTRVANDQWRQQCQQRSQKAARARLALDAAERVVPASQEERAIGRAAGKRVAKTAGRRGEEPVSPRKRKDEDSRPRKVEARRERRPKPPKAPRKSPPSTVDELRAAGQRIEPSPWERYQQRWPEHADADAKLFLKISRDPDRWRERLNDQFMRQQGLRKWDQTPSREATETLALPRALAAEGKVERGAAESEPDYVDSLPERYRQKWEESGIGERVREVAEQARTSLRAQLSFTPEKHVEDAVRKECGADAQRLDREMRQEMQQDRALWEVLSRMDTMRGEEGRAAMLLEKQVSAEHAQALAGPSRTESPPAQPSWLPTVARPMLAGSQQHQAMPGAPRKDPDLLEDEEDKKKKRRPISIDR